MNDIIIIGAGGFGREVSCLISDINKYSVDNQYNILGFIDDNIKKGTIIHDKNVLGGKDYLQTLEKKPLLVFGLGHPAVKKELSEELSDFIFPTIIHPKVSMNGYNIKLGTGCVICEGTILTCDIDISNFVTINLSCTIGHDVKINKFSSLMPSVNVSGEVSIGENVFIGTGVKIINQITVGKNSIIGAGAVLSNSIPENCTAVGVPAKPIKFNK